MSDQHSLLVPRVNANDETVVLRRWLVPQAKWVDAGVAVAEIETSKAIVEVAAEAAGYLHHGAPEGGEIAIGDPLGWLTAAADATPLRASPAARNGAALDERLVSADAAEMMKEGGLGAADIPGRGPIRARDVAAVLATRANPAADDWDAIVAHLPNGPGATLIFGADVQGTVVVDCMETREPGTAVVFVDDAPSRATLAGLPVLPSRAIQAVFARGIRRAHVSIAAPPAKLACARRLEDAGFEIVGVRHPTASVALSAVIGAGVFLGPLTLVGPEATVGDYVQINNGASVAHHCVVETAARLSDGVRLAGRVVIGEGAFLGLAVTVNEKITIGRGSTIVSGVSVFDHVPEHCIVRVDGRAYPLRSPVVVSA